MIRILTLWLVGLALGCRGADDPFVWPREWTAFGPIPPDAAMAAGGVPLKSALPAAAVLRTIPSHLEIDGERYPGRAASFDHGRIDLKTFLLGADGRPHRRGERAFLLARIVLPTPQRVRVGAGADWFMHWWLDGVPVFGTLDNGNLHSTIALTNHLFDLDLPAGEHVLAVFVAAGTRAWTLAAGGPAERADAARAAAAAPVADYRREMEDGRKLMGAEPSGEASGMTDFAGAAAAFRRAAALATNDSEKARALLEWGQAWLADSRHTDHDATRAVFRDALGLAQLGDQERAAAWLGIAETELEANACAAARAACDRVWTTTTNAHLAARAHLICARAFLQERTYPAVRARCRQILEIEGLDRELAGEAKALAAAVDVLPLLNRGRPRLFISRDSWPAIKDNALTADRDAFADLARDLSAMHPEAIRTGDWGKQALDAALVYRVTGDEDSLLKTRRLLRAAVEYFRERHALDSRAYARITWAAALDWVWDSLPPPEREDLAASMLDYAWTRYVETRLRGRVGSWPHYYTNGMFWYLGLVLAEPTLDDLWYARALTLLGAGLQSHRDRFADMVARAGAAGAWQTNLDYDFGEVPNMHFAFLHAWTAAVGLELPREWGVVGTWPEFALRMVLEPTPSGDHYNYFNWAGHSGGVWGFGQAWKGYLPAYLDAFAHHFGALHPRQAAIAGTLRQRLAGPGRAGGTFPAFRFLLTGLNRAPAPGLPPDLPLGRYYENIGLVLASSGFDPDATYLLFAPGGGLAQPYVRHDFDAGHFALYRRGHLALDTGARNAQDHCRNYRHQTVAHNCILIRMEGERFPITCCGPAAANSAGQNRDPSHARALAFESDDAFVYAATDLAPAYNPEKCAEMTRQLLFLAPDCVVIFDRVSATKPEYPKTWLLHTANEPLITGQTVRADQDRGRLFCRTLLPADARIEPIGGPGREYWSDGRNWPIPDAWWKSYSRGHTTPPERMGRWRVDVTPGAARKDDLFLHLIQTAGQDMERMVPSRVADRGEEIEMTFAAGSREVGVRFNKTGTVGGHIRIIADGGVIVDRDLAQTVMPQAGLAPTPRR